MAESWTDSTFANREEALLHDRAFLARLQAMGNSAKQLTEEYRFNCAKTLLSAGITLIPSDHLRDHEFVVSRGVYEAAKKLTNHKG